ncbi:MAG TPA: class B sortase [Candidatus Onthovicinus excrementipullorum]|nr:class B sortase [Candidatus Onthovicinus excrementipullorum]
MNDDKNKYTTGNEDWMNKYAAQEELSDVSARSERRQTSSGRSGSAPRKRSAAKTKESRGKRFVKAIIPWKGDPPLEIVRKVLLIVSILVLIGCAIWGINRLSERINSNSSVKNYANMVDESAKLTLDEAEKLYPDVEFPEGMQAKYYSLYALNQDFVGWLTIEGKNISLPIVQGDDNSFYLRRDFEKVDTDYGNPFLDYRNTIQQPFDTNTIIYGHYMRDNMIFSNLRKYMSLSGFRESPVIDFDTLYQDTKWKVYAVFLTNSDPASDNGYVFDYLYTNFPSEASFSAFISHIDQRKLYTTGVDIRPTDKILTLSTCYTNYSDERLVVIARMVRDGESAEVDTSLAYENANPRYPQAWYDKKGQENPFKDANHWTIG